MTQGVKKPLQRMVPFSDERLNAHSINFMARTMPIGPEAVDTSNAISFLTTNVQKKLNASVITDVTSERTTGWLIPTVFFFYRDIQVSGNVMK